MVPSSSPYLVSYDTVIFGTGYAGLAAALSAHRAGKMTLLVSRRTGLVMESGWSFATDTGTSTHPLWQEWIHRLGRCGGLRDGRVAGGVAEILASEWLRTLSVPILYYVAPIDVECHADHSVQAVVVGTKSGIHRLRAREWIDATDAGELAALLDPDWIKPLPRRQIIHLSFTLAKTPSRCSALTLSPQDLPIGAQLVWESGLWPRERILRIELPGDFDHPRRAWLPALRTLQAQIPESKGALLTHGSIVPFSQFDPASTVSRNPSPNVRFIGAQGETLAEKFAAGLYIPPTPPDDAYALARSQHSSTPIAKTCRRDVEVAVAGLGTGGTVAAIAAARTGVHVLACEAMPFPGGIGTGGGFHVYYFGVPGGLQEEINRRVREIMPLFGTPAQVGGFHPDAKKIVLDQMMTESGVEVLYDAMLVSVKADAGSIQSALFSTPRGCLRIHAQGWVDATGDGDLAAWAGARFRFGRAGDGMPHAYSQSASGVRVEDNAVRLRMPNEDVGYCDPTNEIDLSRARTVGLSHYARNIYTEDDHSTFVAPLVGIRQSRQIVTDYELQLDDLINRRCFPDTVGLTGGHYDNHARDYEFESDEAAFWVWTCQQWYGRLACEIPWRMLLPLELNNVVMACRSCGVSEEAHPSFRMQRDIQRIGEAAGIGSALAVKAGVSCRNVSYPQLRSRLIATGALLAQTQLPLSDAPAPGLFGAQSAGTNFFLPVPSRVDQWLNELKTGSATAAIWHLYRAKKNNQVYTCVKELLGSEDTTVSWRAAAIMAMWGEAAAETRLWEAIRTHEDEKNRDIVLPQQEWFYVPRWYAALTLLKRCVTAASLPLLEELAADASLILNLRSAIALACESLARRVILSSAAVKTASGILDQLLATKAPLSIRPPGTSTLETTLGDGPSFVREDYSWQLYHAVNRARLALESSPLEKTLILVKHDPRSIVRHALSQSFHPLKSPQA